MKKMEKTRTAEKQVNPSQEFIPRYKAFGSVDGRFYVQLDSGEWEEVTPAQNKPATRRRKRQIKPFVLTYKVFGNYEGKSYAQLDSGEWIRLYPKRKKRKKDS